MSNSLPNFSIVIVELCTRICVCHRITIVCTQKRFFSGRFEGAWICENIRILTPKSHYAAWIRIRWCIACQNRFMYRAFFRGCNRSLTDSRKSPTVERAQTATRYDIWRPAERRCRRPATSESAVQQSTRYRGPLRCRRRCTVSLSLYAACTMWDVEPVQLNAWCTDREITSSNLSTSHNITDLSQLFTQPHTALLYEITANCVLWLLLLPSTKEDVNAFARVRLSVCLSVSKITQKRVHGFRWNVACRQTSGHGRTS